MNDKFLRIRDKIEGTTILSVKITDVLPLIPDSFKTNLWLILKLYDVRLIDISNRNALEIEEKLDKSNEEIVIVDFEELINIFSNVLEAQEILLIPNAHSARLLTSNDWDYLCENCDVVIESFDFSYVSIYIKDNSCYSKFYSEFTKIKELDIHNYKVG